jgi:hypothetical protein
VVTSEELAAIGRDPQAQAGLLLAFHRMLKFLGLAQAADGIVQEAPGSDVDPAFIFWVQGPDHNDLRISRILSCLMGAGLTTQAQAFLAYLEKRFSDDAAKDMSLPFWVKAVRG